MKPKDYEPSEEIADENEYAAWAQLRHSDRPLGVGDILELPSGDLRICKYVGFEEARWILPESAPLVPSVDTPVDNMVPPGSISSARIELA